jgi:4-hydroxy-3-polyprenylbenzoate decarboxylase
MDAMAKRIVIGISAASGAVYAIDFVKRAPAEKYLIVSDWGRAVLNMEEGADVETLAPHVKRVFSDKDLAAPFASGSNPFDAFVVIPCSLSTLAKIAAGIGDTLITRVAQVALKERRRMVLALRETPLPTNALENAARLSRDGVVIMPICPPWYQNPKSLDEVVAGFTDKIFRVLDLPAAPGWRAEEFEL